VGEQKKTIGKYEIVSELGRGGMGVVFKAWEESLQRFVAIKMLGDQLTDDENLVARFLREARSVSDLNHPNVVQVFAVDTHEGRPYFAMEFVEGESLTELIRTSRRIDPRRALNLVKEVAAGLSAAHDKGVVHRDIKPDNIMLTKHGGVKVVDFGVARIDDPNTKLTATGMAVGTPNYISPEVCLGLDVDKRSDLFSLGIVFYEMLTGDTPFSADSPLEMMTKVVKAEIPDITSLNPEIDDGVRKILHHMLEKKPDYRYQDLHEVLEDIEAYLNGDVPPHASNAESQPTMQVDLPDLGATIAATAAPRPSSAKGSRLPLAVSLLLIAVAAFAGGWWYLGQQAPPPDEKIADDSSVPKQEVAAPDTSTTDSVLPAELPAAETEEPTLAGSDDAVSESGPEISPDPSDSVVVSPPVAQQPPVAAESTPVNAARATPDYQDPGIVVIVNGDPSVSTAVESALEGALGAAQFTVINEQYFDGLRPGIDLASLGRTVQANGGDVLVIADIRFAGSRQLEFYGRTEQQTSATMQVTAMLLADRSNLGAPWQKSLEYTALTASDEGRDAALPIARELVNRLNELRDSQ